jgi:hypothetical protein
MRHNAFGISLEGFAIGAGLLREDGEFRTFQRFFQESGIIANIEQ